MTTLLLANALPDRLETARLVLRAPDRRDVADMARLANNAKIHAMTTLPHPYGEADALAFVDRIARTDSEHAYAIILPTGTLMGVIGLHLNKDAPPELGYWLGEPFWHKGYTTEAAGALVAAARTTGYCPIVVAKAQSTNAASRAVLEKIGFTLITEAIADCGPHKGVSVATYEIGHAEDCAS